MRGAGGPRDDRRARFGERGDGPAYEGGRGKCARPAQFPCTQPKQALAVAVMARTDELLRWVAPPASAVIAVARGPQRASITHANLERVSQLALKVVAEIYQDRVQAVHCG